MDKINDSLGYLLNTSARLIKRKIDEQLRSHNLTSSQWAVIKLLSAEGHLSQVEIAAKLNSDRATCGVIIDKLIKKGMVSREMSEKDRRSYLVKNTQAANALIEEVTGIAERTNARALAGLAND